MEIFLDYNRLKQRDKAVLMGLFLSRFDTEALESFGFTGFRQAYNVLGYSVGILPKSIQNYRDEFDPYYPNARKGWRNRQLRDFCKELKEATDSLSFDEFYQIIKNFVEDEYIEIADYQRQNKKERKFTANRLITGKAAEEYFVMNYQRVALFQTCSLQDTTNLGCGFDFKLSNDNERYYIEVKGLNESRGNIMLTEKEYRVADELRDKYCLFVVSNFRQTPYHTLFFNPLYTNNLSFQRQEREIIQVSYTANLLL
ncbi:MAG: DUF3883 domain-containing protein [Alloprevotella sp.]|nr:DUF3883 domain-containing protein [Alloprevotella sp.]